MSHKVPTIDPRKRALQQNAGSQIDSILNPLKPQPTKGKPTNHALINRQNLKATQIRNAIRREEDVAKASEEPFKMQRFKGVDSVVKQKVLEATSDNPHSFTRKGEGKGLTAKMTGLTINRTGVPNRSRRGPSSSSVDYNDYDDENIYASPEENYNNSPPRDGQYENEGEEGYPHQQDSHSYNHQQHYSDDDESINQLLAQRGGQQPGSRGGIPASSSSQQSRRAPASMTHGDGIGQDRSYIASNAKKVIAASRAMASARDEAKESIPANGGGIAKHDNFGRVPAYLTEAKNNLAAKKAQQAAEEQEKNSGVPPGMILMPEDQRIKTLEVLNENHKKILYDISCFPLRVETISRKKAKAELEAKLEEIEKAIALFSRKRVLIQP